MPETPRSTVVVGGGLAGLVAGCDLVEAGRRVTVLEASPRVGGKLLLGEVAGVEVDLGAESMLDRRPEGVALARHLGLDVVHPATASASARWRRSSEVVPATTTSPPQRRTPSTLTAGAVSGITTTARQPRRCAANATAWP